MITSRQNRKIKDIRRLRRSKDDRALLEGPHLIAEALEAGVALEYALVTPELLASAEGAAMAAALASRCLLDEVPAELLAAGADADAPQGVAAVAALPRGGAEALPLVAAGRYLYVDGVQDPGNLGALARVAEAAGASGMACGRGCAHPNHPRALRASAGSLLRLPVGWRVGAAGLDERLRALQPRWVSLVAHGGEPLWTAALDGALVLAVGAEGSGLGPEAAARADLALRIPLAAPVESLNVATAAAVALFEICRRRAELSAPSPP
ncbi:MAG TPA: RNA methyltransferase [Thermoanaerobaculia bacterium]|nr:RNA methyltransferase [Thermoanaerobaculia bacterium]